MTKKKSTKKQSTKKAQAGGLTRQAALDLIDSLDSRHQNIRPLLEKAARGEKITDKEFAAAESPFAPVVAVLKDVQSGRANDGTEAAVELMDTRNDVLKPILSALIVGLA